MARSSPVENLLPLFVGSIINYTCSNATEVAQWTAPVAVDYRQQQTMASVTVVQIDTINKAVSLESHLHMHAMGATNKECGKRDRSRDLWNTGPQHCLCDHSGWLHRQIKLTYILHMFMFTYSFTCAFSTKHVLLQVDPCKQHCISRLVLTVSDNNNGNFMH